MADETLGTGPQRMRVGGLARRFRATGSREDLDNLEAGIELFKEQVADDKAASERAITVAEPDQPPLPEGEDAGSSAEGD